MLRTSLCASRRPSSLTSSWQKEPRVSMPKILINYLPLSHVLTSRTSPWNNNPAKLHLRNLPQNHLGYHPKNSIRATHEACRLECRRAGHPQAISQLRIFRNLCRGLLNDPQPMVHECGCNRALQNWEKDNCLCRRAGATVEIPQCGH